MNNGKSYTAVIEALESTRDRVIYYTRELVAENHQYKLYLWSVKANLATKKDERACLALHRKIKQTGGLCDIELDPCGVFVYSGYGDDHAEVMHTAQESMQ